MFQPVANGTIAHLIMVLGEYDKTIGRYVLRRSPPAALSIIRVFAGIDESLLQCFCKLFHTSVISIIALPFSGKERMDAVVKIVEPLGVESETAAFLRPYKPRVVLVSLGNKEAFPSIPARTGFYVIDEFLNKGIGTDVKNPVGGVEAEHIDVIMVIPVESVFDKVVAHTVAVRPVYVHCLSPWAFVVISEERTVLAHIAPLGAEVIVDNIELYCYLPFVTLIDQPF
jgi:hypothetical protein